MIAGAIRFMRRPAAKCTPISPIGPCSIGNGETWDEDRVDAMTAIEERIGALIGYWDEKDFSDPENIPDPQAHSSKGRLMSGFTSTPQLRPNPKSKGSAGRHPLCCHGRACQWTDRYYERCVFPMRWTYRRRRR